MKKHDALYENDRSLATVALVYDHASSLKASDAGRLNQDYLHDLQTCERILDAWHLPYDIIDSERLNELDPCPYAALLIPSPIALHPDALTQLTRLHRSGVGLVATGFPPQQKAAFEELFGARVIGEPVPTFQGPHPNPVMAYAKIKEPAHPICRGIEPAVIPIVTPSLPVEPAADATIILTRGGAFRLFPEGLAFPDAPDPDNPLCLVRDLEETGRTVWFPIAAGRVAKRTGHPDNERLIVNAVEWAARGHLPLRCEGVPDLMLSIRQASERTVIHAINTTGRHRYLRDFVPLHDVTLHLPRKYQSACLHEGERSANLVMVEEGPGCEIRLPKITDYALLELR